MGSWDTLYWAQNICTDMSLSAFAFLFSSAFVYLKCILIDYVSDEIEKFFFKSRKRTSGVILVIFEVVRKNDNVNHIPSCKRSFPCLCCAAYFKSLLWQE